MPSSASTESYGTITRSEATIGLGLPALPARFDDYAFDSAFRYQGDRNRNGTVYAFWINSSGAEIQIVRGEGTVESAELGAHDIGGAILFKKQVGRQYLYVLAPDQRTLSRVLATVGL